MFCLYVCMRVCVYGNGIRITKLPAVSQVAVAQSSGTRNASSEHSAICSSPQPLPSYHSIDPLPLATLVVLIRPPTQNSSKVCLKWNRHPVANYGVFDLSPAPTIHACTFLFSASVVNRFHNSQRNKLFQKFTTTLFFYF